MYVLDRNNVTHAIRIAEKKPLNSRWFRFHFDYSIDTLARDTIPVYIILIPTMTRREDFFNNFL